MKERKKVRKKRKKERTNERTKEREKERNKETSFLPFKCDLQSNFASYGPFTLA
jgi:hypothetical protein